MRAKGNAKDPHERKAGGGIMGVKAKEDRFPGGEGGGGKGVGGGGGGGAGVKWDWDLLIILEKTGDINFLSKHP